MTCHLNLITKSEAFKPRLAHRARAYPGFHSMKRLGISYYPLDGMLIHQRVISSNKFHRIVAL